MTTMTPERVFTDSQLHRRVIDELKWDSVVDETDVGVEVDNHVVTLTGSVASYAEKAAARDAVLRVAGVLDVANDVTVKIPGDMTKTDTDIAHAVRRALDWDVIVPSDKIKSTVAQGWITLDGDVSTWRQRADAERTVKNLAGVRGVVNRIRVVPAAADPETVRTAIEDALERQAGREADRLSIRVRDGALTLTGRVRSWYEKRAVMGAASHAPGVSEVFDQIVVDPSF